MKDILDADPKNNIIIKGAHLHNLKNIDLSIPRNKMCVITGLSGSGKSSLAFDTCLPKVNEDMLKAFLHMQDNLWAD